METNRIENPAAYHAAVTNQITQSVPWDTPGLKVIRLRLVSDPGFPCWDVSYCTGMLDGKPVDVSLPFSQLVKPMRHPKRASLVAQVIAYAARDRVYAKGLGILDCISTLS